MLENKSFIIVHADERTIDLVAMLFDQYRQFLNQPPDLQGAYAFVQDRIAEKDTSIFLALQQDRGANIGLGFMQLTTSWYAVTMQKVITLNDLFVTESARKIGIGKAFLQVAQDYARQQDATHLQLFAALNNYVARDLYERNGYERDYDFYRYLMAL